MKYNTFTYGSGVLYGAANTVDSILPESGVSEGGDNFVVQGTGFINTSNDDDFTSSLNTVLWTDISVGGSVQTGVNHLVLSTGSSSGQTSGIESVSSYSDFQAEIFVNVPNDVNPPGDVKYLVYELYINATTKAAIEIKKDIEGNFSLYCYTTNGGNVTSEQTKDWSRGNSTFKILRFGSVVYFIANGSVIFKAINFRGDVAKVRMYADNGSENFDVKNTAIKYYKFKPFVVFNDQPVHDTVIVSDKRARGKTPPSINERYASGSYAGLVDISVVSSSTTTGSNMFEYVYSDKLRLINSTKSGIKLSLISDPQISSPSGTRIGLGDGK